MKTTFVTGDKLKCINAKDLPGLDSAPPLKIGDSYQVKNIIQDSEGNDHLDVGLVSTVNFVRSLETKEHLPDGDKIHWCHPSRFELSV